MNNLPMPQFKDSQTAFAEAIEAGRLSADPKSPIYAGCFMYMCTTHDGDGKPHDLFKHIDTRKYIP